MSNSTADLIRGLSSGTTTIEQAGGFADAPSESEHTESTEQHEPSVTDEFFAEVGNEENPADQVASAVGETKPVSKAQPVAAKPVSDPNKEFIIVTDDKGRRKVEIDYTNKDSIKRAFQIQAGARKWQAERDQAIARAKELESKKSELEETWRIANDSYAKNGIEGLVDLVAGKQGTYKDHVQKEIDRANFLKRATPEEIDALNYKEQLERERKEAARNREENDKFRAEMQKEREDREIRSVENTLHPSFEKYRFADKLGDETAEGMFDEMLWTTTLKRLEPYEEKGLLSQEIVEREFRTVSSTLRKRINVQAEKRVTKVTEQKKQEATENVQAKVMSGYKPDNSLRKEAQDLVKNGNTKDLIKNWSKYAGMFGKK